MANRRRKGGRKGRRKGRRRDSGGGTSILKIILGVGGGLALVGFCFVATCTYFVGKTAQEMDEQVQEEKKKEENRKKQVRKSNPGYISLEKIIKEYEENEVRADNKYRDKIIGLKGKLTKIGKTYGEINISLNDYQLSLDLQEGQDEVIGKLNKGEKIKVKGICKGWTGSGDTSFAWLNLKYAVVER